MEVDRRTDSEDRTVPHSSMEAHSEKVAGSDLWENHLEEEVLMMAVAKQPTLQQKTRVLNGHRHHHHSETETATPRDVPGLPNDASASCGSYAEQYGFVSVDALQDQRSSSSLHLDLCFLGILLSTSL